MGGVHRSGYVLFPILTEETMRQFIRRMTGLNIISTPLLRILPRYNSLKKYLGLADTLSREGVLSVFTSKNGVKVLLDYLRDNNIVERYGYIFRRVACIGPSTKNYLLSQINHVIPSLESCSIYVPDENTSEGLGRLVVNLSFVPMLWGSIYVDPGLEEVVRSLGGFSAGIYSLLLDKNMLVHTLNRIEDHSQKIFFVFMSVRSLDAIEIIKISKFYRAYAIFISKRVFDAANVSVFDGCFVYRGWDLDGFYDFVREVVSL